jgi:putative flippase GtrA
VRVFRFNAVGVIGFAVQLGVLRLLLGADVHYLLATAIAVETAILHNFAWHARWTWADRDPGAGLGRRLLRFHAVNGTVSLAGNLILMPILVRACGVPVLPANGLAALGCAAANFAGADRLVFGREPVSSEGRCPSDSPTRSLARRCVGALRSRGSPSSERIGEL